MKREASQTVHSDDFSSWYVQGSEDDDFDPIQHIVDVTMQEFLSNESNRTGLFRKFGAKARLEEKVCQNIERHETNEGVSLGDDARYAVLDTAMTAWRGTDKHSVYDAVDQKKVDAQ